MYYIPDCGIRAARSMTGRRGVVPLMDGNRRAGGICLFRAIGLLREGE